MSQKPVAMEQLKQILQLKKDGIGVREMSRRLGLSRNSIRKYLLLLKDHEGVADKELADQAYNNDLLEHDAERRRYLIDHFTSCGTQLEKTGVTRQLLWQEYLHRYP